MRVVWKYLLRHRYAEDWPRLPLAAKILHVDVADDAVWLWALVNPEDPAREVRRIAYFATGEPIPSGWKYIGTAATPQRDFFWHVYEQPRRKRQ